MNFIKDLNKLQVKAVNASLKQLKGKKDRILIQMATGTGKTETAIKLWKKLGKPNSLWITHRNELVAQSYERFLKYSNEKDIGMFNSLQRDTNKKMIIASIQTLSRPENLNSFSKRAFKFVFVDEAHHAPAETWTKVLQYFKAKRIGLTATPIRPDGLDVIGKDGLFGNVSYGLPFEVAQKKKFLAKHEAWTILTNSVIHGFTGTNGDYTSNQLDRLYTSVNRNDIIINSYIKYGKRSIIKAGMIPKTICFCVNIQHARRMSRLFKKKGINAEFISSNSIYQTPKKRQEVFDKFKNGDIEIICSVDIFNEGVDVPKANVAIMARPTRSNILYQQQIGRVSRSNKGKKKFFLILDFVDQTRRGYQGYVLGNLVKNGTLHSRIIADYVKEKDPIKIEQKVLDILEGIKNFENKVKEMRSLTRDVDEKDIKFLLKNKLPPKDLYKSKGVVI